MTNKWTCQSCSHKFVPKDLSIEVQCPMCGTIVDPTEVPTNVKPKTKPKTEPEKVAKTEITKPPTKENPRPHLFRDEDSLGDLEPSLPESQHSPQTPGTLAHAIEAEKVSQQFTPSRPSVPRYRPSILEFFETLGPTLLVCMLFLGWVFYDKTLRPPSGPAVEISINAVDQLLKESVYRYKSGDLDEAIRLAQQATKTGRYPKTADELLDLYKAAAKGLNTLNR